MISCLASEQLRKQYAKKARKDSSKMLRQEHAPRAREVFRAYDKDGSGTIDEAELDEGRAAILHCHLLSL